MCQIYHYYCNYHYYHNLHFHCSYYDKNDNYNSNDKFDTKIINNNNIDKSNINSKMILNDIVIVADDSDEEKSVLNKKENELKFSNVIYSDKTKNKNIAKEREIVNIEVYQNE